MDQKNTLNRQIDRELDAKPALNWRVLAVLNLYRVLVPLMLIGLYLLGGSKGINLESSDLFLARSPATCVLGLPASF